MYWYLIGELDVKEDLGRALIVDLRAYRLQIRV
jgi:hypothetical protein